MFPLHAWMNRSATQLNMKVSPSQICFIFKLSLLVATSAPIPSNLAGNPLDQLFRS
jgi:hypothetical protein